MRNCDIPECTLYSILASTAEQFPNTVVYKIPRASLQRSDYYEYNAPDEMRIAVNTNFRIRVLAFGRSQRPVWRYTSSKPTLLRVFI
jgi:hypothetical protein